MIFHRSLLFITAAAFVAGAAVPAPTTTLVPREEQTTSKLDQSAVPTGDFTTTKHETIGGVTNGHVTIPAKTIDIVVPTCVQTIEPDSNGYLPPGTCNAIWDYYPSFAAAVAFASMFGVLLFLHVWQAAKYKKKWCWVIIMAALWETLAFTFRALSSKNQQNSTIYLVFQIFILLAPLWVNAFIYMTLGRMIYFFHPAQSILRIPAPAFAALFVGLDIISFVIQLIGGSMAGPTAPLSQQLKSIHVYMGGIGLQEFFILIFVGLCIVFQRQMTALKADRRSKLLSTEWGRLLCTMYLSLLMISIRIIYRLIEFSGGMGQDNPLTTKEAYFYVLEATPMIIALAAFNIMHPGKIITGPNEKMPGLIATIRGKVARRNNKIPISNDSSDEEEILEYEMRHPNSR